MCWLSTVVEKPNAPASTASRISPLICAVSSGVAPRSIDASPMTQWRNGVKGAMKARLSAEPRLAAASRNSGKVCQSQVMPRSSTSKGDALDIDQIAHRHFARFGPARRDADAAIAHHHRGDAVPGRGADRRVPADLRVVTGVRVDKAGRDDAIGGVDDPLGAVLDLADLGDLAVRDRDVGMTARRAGAVDHCAVL